MTEQEILEGNKLIAEFMGWVPKNGDLWVDESNNNLPQNEKPKCLTDRWLYNSSWDWLMPVVREIEKLRYEVVIRCLDCQIFNRESSPAFICHKWSDTKIKSVYAAVVQFIKWYNSQSQKS